MLVIPANARSGYETCVHYNVDLTLHSANIPHTKKTIFNRQTVLCRFMLAPDAVLTGNDAVPTTSPVPSIDFSPTPCKRPIMSSTDASFTA